jgi:hypothetical protein
MSSHREIRNRAIPRVAGRRAKLDGEFWAEQRQRMARRVHGFVASTKMSGPLHWRSLEEADLLRLLEVDARIDAIETLPEQVQFMLDGAPRSHVPAIRVRSGDRIAVLDALRLGEEKSPTRTRLTQILTTIYRAAGIVYRAVPRRAVRAEPRFANAVHVLEHRGYEATGPETFGIIEALSRTKTLTIAQLEQAVPSPGTRAAACTMAMRNTLLLDLATAATPDLIGVQLWRLS